MLRPCYGYVPFVSFFSGAAGDRFGSQVEITGAFANMLSGNRSQLACITCPDGRTSCFDHDGTNGSADDHTGRMERHVCVDGEVHLDFGRAAGGAQPP